MALSVCAIIWQIWKARNREVIEGQDTAANEICGTIKHYSQEVSNAFLYVMKLHSIRIRKKDISPMCWSTPRADYIKHNRDGSTKEDQNGRIGGILRNQRGEWIKGSMGSIQT